MSLSSRTRRFTRPETNVFDVALATEAVPLVQRIVDDIRNLKSRLGLIQQEHKQALQASSVSSRDRFRREDDIRQLRAELRSAIDELHAMGGVLLDPLTGDVGLPTLVNGSLAYLVYRQGAPSLSHWRYRDQPRLRPIPSHWMADPRMSSQEEEEGLRL